MKIKLPFLLATLALGLALAGCATTEDNRDVQPQKQPAHRH